MQLACCRHVVAMQLAACGFGNASFLRRLQLFREVQRDVAEGLLGVRTISASAVVVKEWPRSVRVFIIKVARSRPARSVRLKACGSA